VVPTTSHICQGLVGSLAHATCETESLLTSERQNGSPFPHNPKPHNGAGKPPQTHTFSSSPLLTNSQKASKQIARRNATSLNTLHVTSLSIHLLFIIYRLLLHWRSTTTSVYTKYILFSLPALLIEAYLEKISRPIYAAGDLRRVGEDLDAKGLMEYMWDVIHVTWGCLAGVAVFGEWVWWLWVSIELENVRWKVEVS